MKNLEKFEGFNSNEKDNEVNESVESFMIINSLKTNIEDLLNKKIYSKEELKKFVNKLIELE